MDQNKLWKILKEMGIPDHLTCLLRNLYAGQEQQLELDMEQQTVFQIGKGVRQGCILSPCLFNLYAEYIMRNVRLEEAQAGIKVFIFTYVYIHTHVNIYELHPLKEVQYVQIQWKIRKQVHLFR